VIPTFVHSEFSFEDNIQKEHIANQLNTVEMFNPEQLIVLK
jgi:hypothetical protein